MSNNANIGYLFYKEYYQPTADSKPTYEERKDNDNDKKHNQKFFELKNKDILERTVTENDFLNTPWESKPKRNIVTFVYQTSYPGLVLGTGYTHEAGLMGEFKLGFYFDYTTGMPIIPGSSVKGLLRSVFPGREKDQLRQKEKAFYIWYLLGREKPVDEEGISKMVKKVSSIEKEIFEGVYDISESAEKKVEKCYPIYKRDIFFDAVLTAGDFDGYIFGTDYITPHKHKTDRALDPFTDPVPLMFLKVLPNVLFEFGFCLHDGQLKVAEKEKLFRLIIEDIGIGAKTNVGYGQLYEEDIL